MAATKRARETAENKVATSVTSTPQDQIRSAISKIESDESISGHDYAPMALTGLRKSIVWLDRIEEAKDE
jgi:hypothetical protein